MLRVVKRDTGTHLQVPDANFPLPELCPQGVEFWGRPPEWPLLGFQGLYDLKVAEDRSRVTLALRVV